MHEGRDRFIEGGSHIRTLTAEIAENCDAEDAENGRQLQELPERKSGPIY